MTRQGKIARLPKRVRDQLNRRLDDGELGKKLVAWLNGLPEVRDIIEVEFGSRPISEQNLSEWKKGGFQDWQRAQESQDFARGLSEEAKDVADAAGGASMADHASTLLSLALARVFTQLSPKSAKSARVRRELLEIADALVNLRRSDQGSALVRMKQDWHERELEAARAKDPSVLEQMTAAHRKKELEPFRLLSHELKRQRLLNYFQKQFGLKDEQWLRDFVDMPTHRTGPEKVENSGESDSIQVDQTT